MVKHIKTRKQKYDKKSTEFQTLVRLVQESLRTPRRKRSKPSQEGEILIEFVRSLAKESTKSFRPEFAGLMGLKESGLNSVLYQGNITGKHLANILLQLSNSSAEEFISEFIAFLINKTHRDNPPEWLDVFLKIKNLTDEEKKYLAMIGLKFDEMIERRKK